MSFASLTDRPAPHLFSLPPGRPFFDDLVAALLRDLDDHALPRATVFVPSRRAVRAMKESFARKARGQALLLPRILAVADLSEDDALSLDTELRVDQAIEAPPLPVKRLKLAQIYRMARQAEGAEPPSWPTALRAADQLARTHDQLTEYSVTLDDLHTLGSEPAMADAANHWKEVLRVVELAARDWPTWLQQEGLVDARVRRNMLLEAVTASMVAGCSDNLLMAAGFLGTSPSTARFLGAVAEQPRGAVVLPAFDHNMSDEAWSKIEAPHPQSAYRDLLIHQFGGVTRSDVLPLTAEDKIEETERRTLISMALMPAEATDTWYDEFTRFKAGADVPAALQGLRVAVARDQEEEADFIALRMRETLEEQGQSAFLVTADRTLGRRVAAKMKGWGIELDDSGGFPLSGSYRATFLRQVARVMANPSDPVALASLIHHQLFQFGLDAKERVPMVRALDQLLRGRRPREGWDGLERSLEDEWRPAARALSDEEKAKARQLIIQLRTVFITALASAGNSLRGYLDAHLAIAENLAARQGASGTDYLYRFEDGEVLKPHLDALRSRPELLPGITLDAYPDVFDALLQGPAVRPPGGQHPRLGILGVVEARLQTANLVIVGGLQEGVWPGDEVVDPFLSRRMRTALGMPSPEMDVGRAAHDFSDFACAKNVLLTRSERRGRSPANPSRFMVRLESFLDALGPVASHVPIAEQLRPWRAARYLLCENQQPAQPPSPAPPLHLRPRQLSVSDISTWRRDPYALYARKILKLRVLEPYDAPFTARHRGDLLHALLQRFIEDRVAHGEGVPKGAITSYVPDIIDAYDMPMRQRILNAKFLRTAIETFEAFEVRARGMGVPKAVETKGVMELDLGEGKVLVSARADRIDLYKDGYHIIDYKSGGTASLDEDENFSPQLFLSALIAQKSGFEHCPPERVSQVSFLPLNKDLNVFAAKTGKAFERGDALQERLASFETNFRTWLAVQLFTLTPMRSQIRPFRTDIIGDYDDLARRGEWARGADV